MIKKALLAALVLVQKQLTNLHRKYKTQKINLMTLLNYLKRSKSSLNFAASILKREHQIQTVTFSKKKKVVKLTSSKLKSKSKILTSMKTL